jgi:hypothetical protein
LLNRYRDGLGQQLHKYCSESAGQCGHVRRRKRHFPGETLPQRTEAPLSKKRYKYPHGLPETTCELQLDYASIGRIDTPEMDDRHFSSNNSFRVVIAINRFHR